LRGNHLAGERPRSNAVLKSEHDQLFAELCHQTPRGGLPKKMPSSASSHVQNTLIASVVKLEESNRLTDKEIEWLRGSIMRLVSEFAMLKDAEIENESADPEPQAA
jgi:hypothetical protein